MVILYLTDDFTTHPPENQKIKYCSFVWHLNIIIFFNNVTNLLCDTSATSMIIMSFSSGLGGKVKIDEICFKTLQLQLPMAMQQEK